MIIGNMLVVALLSGGIVGILAIIGFYKNKSRLFFELNICAIKKANEEFGHFLRQETGYFSFSMLSNWKDKHSSLYEKTRGRKYKNILLEKCDFEEIETFLRLFLYGEKIRKNQNDKFVENEVKIYADYFDNVGGRKLDDQQRKAIVTDEDNNLVIAGAGSGKTTTIIGKVNYIIDRYKVNPNEILVISFTNKSATDLSTRISVDGVVAQTFHKFGKNIIAQAEGRQPSIYDEDQFYPFLTKQFDSLLAEDKYLRLVIKYFNDYLKPYRSQFEFSSQSDYIKYLKENNFRPYKPVTLNLEVVKSIEEQKIANFLAFNGIEYQYEYPYEHDTATNEHGQYKPDFTLVQNGRTVYLEHFAVSRDWKVPPFFAKPSEAYEVARQRYLRKIDWARNTHAQHQTSFIETYSYEMSEGVLFDNLSSKLSAAGIQIFPLTAQEQWNLIQSSSKQDVSGFIRLIHTFITLAKSSNNSIADILKLIDKQDIGQSKERSLLFLQIIQPLWDRYESVLQVRNEIDFSDMIDRACGYLATKQVPLKARYLLIDEFQDISRGRYRDGVTVFL